MALEVGRGVTVLMPRWLDNAHNRAPTFERYLVLRDRVYLPDETPYQFGSASYWVDPTTAVDKGMHRGIAWQGFTGEGDGANLA
jgi:hypothetical protein